MALILTPMAAAMESTASFDVRGSTSFPEGTSLSFSPLALLAKDTSALRGLTLHAPHAQVIYTEKEWQQVWLDGETPGGRVQTRDAMASWSLTSLNLELVGEGKNGILGLYPKSMIAQATVLAATNLEPRSVSTVYSEDKSLRDDPGLPYYAEEIHGEHLLFESPLDLMATGEAAIKLHGPEVILAADENTTRFDTGLTVTGDGLSKKLVSKILYIEFSDATLTLVSEGAVQVAARSVSEARFDGELVFRPVAGQLVTRDAVYTPERGQERLEGAFHARLVPIRYGQDLLASLELDGELRSTSLAMVRVKEPLVASGAAGWWLGGGLGVLALGGAAMVLLTRRRRMLDGARQSPAAPRDVLLESLTEAQERAAAYEARAEEAAEGFAWAHALDLIRAARSHHPHDPGFAMKEAWYLYKLTRYEEAMGVFDDVAPLVLTGDADRWATLCAVRLGDFDRAASYLKRALRQNPYLWEIESEPELAPLMDREDVQNALEVARTRRMVERALSEDDDERRRTP